MKFNFDKIGGFLLFPPQYIELSFEDLDLLIKELPFSEHRNFLWKEYQNYLSEIMQLLQTNFFQYLDGSFITQKINPNDIDVVSFIDANLWETHLQDFNKISKKYKNIDAYYIGLYASEHNRYENYTKAGLLEFEKTFGHTKLTRSNKQHKKCFIKVNFQYEKYT